MSLGAIIASSGLGLALAIGVLHNVDLSRSAARGGSWWGLIASYQQRKAGQPIEDRGTPLDLHNWRDVVIAVVAVLLFIGSATWLVAAAAT